VAGATAVVSAAVAGATAVVSDAASDGDGGGTGAGLDGIGTGGRLDPGLGGGGGGGGGGGNGGCAAGPPADASATPAGQTDRRVDAAAAPAAVCTIIESILTWKDSFSRKRPVRTKSIYTTTGTGGSRPEPGRTPAGPVVAHILPAHIDLRRPRDADQP